MATTRRHNARIWMRTAADADGRLLARDVRAWFDTGAYADNGPRVTATGGDAAPGPYRWSAVRVDAAVRLHEHGARPGRTAPSAPPTSSGSARCRWTRWPAAPGSTRSRSAATQPGAPRRAGAARREAARRRPRRRRREGRGRARLGPAARPGHRAWRLRRPPRGRRAPGLERHRPDGGRRRGHRPRGLHRDGPGTADRVRADRRRGARDARGAGHLPRHGHALHALRPVHRRQPLHDARRARRPARRRPRPGRPPGHRGARLAGRDGARSSSATARRGAATSRGPTRSSSPGGSASPGAS